MWLENHWILWKRLLRTRTYGLLVSVIMCLCDSSLSFPFPLRLRNLEASGWMNHVHKILLAATKIAHCVGTQRLSVLVHCSDGWDRTAQLTSLRFASISGRCRHCLRSLSLLLSVSAACCFLTATTALWRAS
jgi:hypothetical protein